MKEKHNRIKGSKFRDTSLPTAHDTASKTRGITRATRVTGPKNVEFKTREVEIRAAPARVGPANRPFLGVRTRKVQHVETWVKNILTYVTAPEFPPGFRIRSQDYDNMVLAVRFFFERNSLYSSDYDKAIAFSQIWRFIEPPKGERIQLFRDRVYALRGNETKMRELQKLVGPALARIPAVRSASDPNVKVPLHHLPFASVVSLQRDHSEHVKATINGMQGTYKGNAYVSPDHPLFVDDPNPAPRRPRIYPLHRSVRSLGRSLSQVRILNDALDLLEFCLDPNAFGNDMFQYVLYAAMVELPSSRFAVLIFVEVFHPPSNTRIYSYAGLGHSSDLFVAARVAVWTIIQDHRFDEGECYDPTFDRGTVSNLFFGVAVRCPDLVSRERIAVDLMGWYQTSPLVVDQLNGSHGEVTQDDDLDQAERARRHREAQNHLHQKPVNDRNVDRAARRIAEHRNRAAAADPPQPPAKPAVAVEPKVVEVPPEEVFFLVYDPLVPADRRLGWDGSSVYTWTFDGKFKCKDGAIRDALPYGPMFNVKNHGPGFFSLKGEEGKIELSTSAATSVFVVDEFVKSDGSFFLHQVYTVFLPLLKELKKALPNPTVTEHLVKAAYATAERSFAEVPHPVVVDTVGYFIALKWKSAASLMSLVGPAASHRPLTLQDENPAYVTSLGVHVAVGAPFRVDSATCNLEDTYLPRCDATVKIRGGEVDFEEYFDTGDAASIVYPSFDVAENTTSKYYRTCFFQFVGDQVDPFVLYDVNGTNACKALKRILGTRDHEDVYTKMQYSLFRGFLRSQTFLCGHDIDFSDKLLSVLRVTPEEDLSAVRVGDAQHSHNVVLLPRSPDILNDSPADLRLNLLRRRALLDELCEVVGAGVQRDPLRLSTGLALDLFDNISEHYLSSIMTDCNPNTVWNYANKFTDAGKNLSHWAYYKGFDMYLSSFEPFLSRAENAMIPHVKKKLREAYVKGVLLHSTEDIMVEKLNGCVKKEWAKFGKVPRLFVSYDAGCMYANELPEYVKIAMDGIRVYRDPMPDGVDFVTIVRTCAKMTSTTMDEVFESIRDSLGLDDYLMVNVYSDDTVYSGSVQGVKFAKNVDISSCDASNKFPIFYGLGKIMGQFNKECAVGLLKQCTLPITVRNPSDSTSKITVKLDSAFEGSGTVLTTILNHFASGLGARFTGLLLSRATEVRRSKDIDQYILMGSLLSGHKVTIEDASVNGDLVLEKVQFLKHSMLQTTTGAWTYAINYGTVFRSLGTVEGDLLPEQLGVNSSQFGQLSWNERMDMFCSSVVKGFCNEPQSPIITALHERFHTSCTPTRGGGESPQVLVQEGGGRDRSDQTLSIASVMRRYDVTEDELDELIAMIKGIKLGTIYSSRAVSQFSHLDYGADRRGV